MRARDVVLVLGVIGLGGCGPRSGTGTGTGTGTGSGTRETRPAPPTAALLERAADLDGVVIGALAPDQRATVAIVFASWCGHCRDEIRELEILRADHPDVRIVGVNYVAHEEYDGRGDVAAVRAFVADRAPWMRVIPADEAMWTLLGRPPKVPTLFVFDRQGALARTYDRRVDPLPTFQDLAVVIAALP